MVVSMAELWLIDVLLSVLSVLKVVWLAKLSATVAEVSVGVVLVPAAAVLVVVMVVDIWA